MKTFLKVAAAILALIIIIAVGLNLYFTDERLKNMALPYVNDAVGRTVEVESMSLTFFSTFPQPGLSIEKLHIPGQTPSPSDTLLSLDQLLVSVELFSLMGDQIEVSEVDLRNPKFTYVIYPDSSTNLDFLMTTEETPEDTASAGLAVNIPSFQVSGGQFGYRDSTSNTSAQINDLNADISLRYADLIQSTINLQLGSVSASADGSTYLNNLPLAFNQQSTINLENETFTIDEGTVSIRGMALNLSGSISNWSDSLNADLSYRSSSDNFGELLRLAPPSYQEDLSGIETRGSLTIDGTLTGALLGDRLPDFDLNMQVGDGYLKYESVPKAIENISVDAHANPSAITINSMSLEAATNTFSMQGIINQPMEEQQRSIDLKTNLKFDLATIKEFYPIDEDTLEMRGMFTANATLKGKADQIERSVQSGSISLTDGFISHKSLGKPIQDITLQSNLNGPTLSIDNASFQTGDNNLSASGTVNNYLGENRSVDLQLNGNADLSQITDYYQLEPTITSLTGSADLDLNMSGQPADPANMQFNGQLTAKGVNMDGEAMVQPLNNLNGELSLSPNSVDLNKLNFNLGSSDFLLSGSLDNYMEYLKAKENRSTTPHLSGSYKSKLLNVDELIDWEDTTATEPIPIHLPDLNSSVTTEISKMIVTDVPMQNLQAKASISPTQITLEKATVELFDGEASGTFTWEVPQPDRTMISFSGSLDSLQAETFFREYPILGKDSELHKYLSGAFTANVDYYSELDVYLQPVMKTSTMDGDWGMTKARLKGHPLQKKVASFIKADELKNMALDEWKSTYTLKDNIFTIEDLRLTSGNIGAEMNGTQHMIEGDINYQIKLFLPGRFKKAIASIITQKAANALTQENGTIMVPLRVRGTYEKPIVTPDEKTIAPIVKDYLKDKAGDVLKNLFDG